MKRSLLVLALLVTMSYGLAAQIVGTQPETRYTRINSEGQYQESWRLALTPDGHFQIQRNTADTHDFATNIVPFSLDSSGNVSLTGNLSGINSLSLTSITAGGFTLTGSSGVLKSSAGIIAGGATTSDLSEGSNLYYTQGRFDSAFAGKSTTNLAEGTNLYYTDARARAAFSATGPLTYSSGSFGMVNQGTTTTVLHGNAAGNPAFGSVSLQNDVSDVLNEVHGGTNQNSYALGDMLYSSGTNALSKLAGNTTSTRKFLRQAGTGSVSAAPAWDTVTASDVGLGSVDNTSDATKNAAAVALTNKTGFNGLVVTANTGVITTGTWNASAIGDAYISSASAWSAKQTAYTNLSGIGALANASGWLHNDGLGVFAYSTPTYADVGAPNTSGSGASGTWGISVTGNAATVTNGVYTSGSYSDPTWLTLSKGKVGLGNVENTALSTWAGTSSVTTLGTVTTGTWHGSAIGDSYISSASTWSGKQAAYANLTTIGSLADSAGWLHDNGTGTFAYSTPTYSDVGAPSTSGTNATGTWAISVSGNAGTVTSGVYTSGSYSDPSWLTISKSKVGLGSVENTALSTWPGTTSVTTLGTITTGTWHGSAIDHTYLTGIAQADVSGLTAASSPTFAGLTVTGAAGIAKFTTGAIGGSAAASDLNAAYGSQTQNYVLASPNGSAGAPSFRALVVADIPTLNQSTTGSAATLSISGQTALLSFTGLTSISRTKTVRDAADTLLELGGSYTPSGTWNWTSASVTWPTFNQSTTGAAASLSISGQTGLLTFTGLASTSRVKTVRDSADTLLELGGTYTPTGTWDWRTATVTWPTFNQNTSGTASNITAYTINQNLGTANSPTFAGVTVTGAAGVAKFTTGAIGGSATMDDIAEGTTYKRLTATKDGYLTQSVTTSASPAFAAVSTGTNPATSGTFRTAYGYPALMSRNSVNSDNIGLIAMATVGGTANTIEIGDGGQASVYINGGAGLQTIALGVNRPIASIGAQLDILASSTSTAAMILDGPSSWAVGGFEQRLNGDPRVRISTVSTVSNLSVLTTNLGDDTAGPSLLAGRNNSAGTHGPSAGTLTSYSADGTPYRLWVDTSGQYRIHSAAPTGSANSPSVSDVAGVIVGTQTSSRDAKNISSEFKAYSQALRIILTTPIYEFTYKSGSFNGEQFVGIITDYSPEFGMDRDAAHPGGKSFNAVSAFGYTVASFKALNARIVELEDEVRLLKQFYRPLGPEAVFTGTAVPTQTIQ